jgi:hypothetical protein
LSTLHTLLLTNFGSSTTQTSHDNSSSPPSPHNAPPSGPLRLGRRSPKRIFLSSRRHPRHRMFGLQGLPVRESSELQQVHSMHRQLRRCHWHPHHHGLSCRPRMERWTQSLRIPIRLDMQFWFTVNWRHCRKSIASAISVRVHHLRLRSLWSDRSLAVGHMVPSQCLIQARIASVKDPSKMRGWSAEDFGRFRLRFNLAGPGNRCPQGQN